MINPDSLLHTPDTQAHPLRMISQFGDKYKYIYSYAENIHARPALGPNHVGEFAENSLIDVKHRRINFNCEEQPYCMRIFDNWRFVIRNNIDDKTLDLSGKVKIIVPDTDAIALLEDQISSRFDFLAEIIRTGAYSIFTPEHATVKLYGERTGLIASREEIIQTFHDPDKSLGSLNTFSNLIIAFVEKPLLPPLTISFKNKKASEIDLDQVMQDLDIDYFYAMLGPINHPAFI